MMKKILAILIGAALVLSMAGAVAADKTITGSEGSTVNVGFNIGEQYTIVIPDDIEFDTLDASKSLVDIKVTKLVIGYDKTLTITVGSDSDWNLIFDPDGEGTESASKIPYELTYTPKNNADSFVTSGTLKGTDANAPIFKTSMDTKDATTSLSVIAKYDGTTITAKGDHEDTLTFSVSVA